MPKYKYLYRPSLMKRRYLCPASAILENNLPDELESDICKEGTMIHDALARGVCPAFFTDIQRDMFEYCMQFKADMFGADDWRNMFIEKKLRLFDDDYSVIIDGTSDLIVIGNDDIISIIDWKFGFKEVDDVIDNLQLACYAAMAMQTYNKSSCICHVVQPRVKKKEPFQFSKLINIIETIKKVINECEESTLENVRYAKEQDMDEACVYCKARFTCEHRKNFVLKSSKDMDLAVSEKKHLVTGMTPVELTSFYLEYKDKLKMMNKYMDEVEKNIIKTALENQDNCAGITLKEKFGNRYIENQESTIKSLEMEKGVSKQIITDSMILNITMLQDNWIKEQKRCNPKTTKKDLEIQFKKLTEEVFKKDKTKVINVESVERLLETKHSTQGLVI